jgi:quercetin dioxygenase-like cupin family protein
MTLKRGSSVLAAIAALVLWCDGANVLAQERPSGAELPKPAQIPGVEPDVLLRAGVPNVPDKALIVSRTIYKPGVHVAWHRHNSQIVFYILHGTMGVQDKGNASFTLKAGDSLLIMPSTMHQHWNASTTEPLVFLEYVLVDKGQPSAVFIK